MEPVKLGDLVLGWDDNQNHIIGMVIGESKLHGFRKEYESRWTIEWPDGVKSFHVTNIIRVMKEDLKRHLNE